MRPVYLDIERVRSGLGVRVLMLFVLVVGGMKPKAMTIRLSADQADALETVATVDQCAVSEVIRAAIAEHIDSRRKDPAFQDSLKDRLERARRLLRQKP